MHVSRKRRTSHSRISEVLALVWFRQLPIAALQNFTIIAILRSASLFLRSGQKPVVPELQVKPGVGERKAPGTKKVSPTRDPAVGPGITLGAGLTPGVIPPRPEKYGTLAWR